MTYQEAVETYINGNISDFKTWVRTCKKIDILNAIEYAESNGIKRHQIIATMDRALDPNS